MLRKLIYILLLTSVVNSCIFVKHSNETDTQPVINLSPKPQIAMSDEIVRSKHGDMISFIPKDWFFVNIEKSTSSEIIAVAVHPDYSLSAVFSTIRANDMMDKTFKKEGLLGLARLSFAKHKRKTAGDLKLASKYQQIEMGPNSFVKYETTTTGGALTCKTAVFCSELNQYYEFSLIPMDVMGKPLPVKQDIRKIFNSILATIKFK